MMVISSVVADGGEGDAYLGLTKPKTKLGADDDNGDTEDGGSGDVAAAAADDDEYIPSQCPI